MCTQRKQFLIIHERKDGEMKSRSKHKAVITALIMIMTMSMATACGNDETGSAFTGYTDDYSQSENNSGIYNNYSHEYSNEENSSTYNFETDIEYSAEETNNNEGFDFTPCSYEEIEEYGYDAYEGPEAYDDYEETSFEESSFGESKSSADQATESSSYGVSDEIDYGEEAIIRTGEFDFKPMPATIGATDATLKARVINRTGKPITAVGCSVYYTYGGLVKSAMIANDCDYDEFDITVNVNEHLEEMLLRGLIYDYKIFVKCDGKVYSHDAVRFATNDVDDKISMEVQTASVDNMTATITATFYNPTGAKVEAVGCRCGEVTLLVDEDKQICNTNDTEIKADFTLHANENGFSSGGKYDYEVFAICDGKEYTIGEYEFTAPQ